jgi:excisionase family DNA binding protein
MSRTQRKFNAALPSYVSGGRKPFEFQLASGLPWQPLVTVANHCAGGLQPMADEILTVPEIAKLLKVADKTVYTMAQRGEIPCFKVRGQWRFRRQDLDLWIASGRIPRK